MQSFNSCFHCPVSHTELTHPMHLCKHWELCAVTYLLHSHNHRIRTRIAINALVQITALIYLLHSNYHCTQRITSHVKPSKLYSLFPTPTNPHLFIWNFRKSCIHTNFFTQITLTKGLKQLQFIYILKLCYFENFRIIFISGYTTF